MEYHVYQGRPLNEIHSNYQLAKHVNLENIRIKNPIFDTFPRRFSFGLCAIPIRFNLINQCLFLGIRIKFNSSPFQPCTKTIIFPSFVSGSRYLIPILRHCISEIFAICCSWVGNIVIVEPLFEFCFMPCIVYYIATCQSKFLEMTWLGNYLCLSRIASCLRVSLGQTQRGLRRKWVNVKLSEPFYVNRINELKKGWWWRWWTTRVWRRRV